MTITAKTKALLMMQMRSGSTMLAAALDSHFQINCPRQEPLHPDELNRLGQVTPHSVATELYNVFGYRVAMFKSPPAQVESLGEKFWQDHDVRVITLIRPNIIRAYISRLIPQKSRGNWHSLDSAHKFEPFHVDPDQMLYELQLWSHWRDSVTQWPYRMGIKHILHLTYDELQEQSLATDGITYLSWRLSKQLCKFLGVSLDGQRLKSEYKRLNPTPLNELVLNWGELQPILEKNGYGPLIEKYGMLKG